MLRDRVVPEEGLATTSETEVRKLGYPLTDEMPASTFSTSVILRCESRTTICTARSLRSNAVCEAPRVGTVPKTVGRARRRCLLWGPVTLRADCREVLEIGPWQEPPARTWEPRSCL